VFKDNTLRQQKKVKNVSGNPISLFEISFERSTQIYYGFDKHQSVLIRSAPYIVQNLYSIYDEARTIYDFFALLQI